MAEFTLAIIAGGKSSRMGQDKSFVELNGRPLIMHVVERTHNLGQQSTILITNQPDYYAHLNLPTYGDVIPDKGSLGGIYTALYHSTNPYTLVVACDMPFLSPDLLGYMLRLTEADTHDVVVPRVDNYPQGLHAVYGKVCRDPIAARLEADRLKVIGFYGDVRVRYIDEDEYAPYDSDGLAFMNVNTPEELERARKIAIEKTL